MPPLLHRFIRFARSVIPTDSAQLLYLSGCLLLFISFQLRWWPEAISDSVHHIGPRAYYSSADPVVLSVNAWIPIYWWCSLVLFVCGAAGLFISLWPGKRPLRCVLLFVWVPSFLALSEIAGRYLYLARDPMFAMLEASFRSKPHNLSWAMDALWQLGPGLHVALAGFILISIFLIRMALGLTSLPFALPDPSLEPLADPDQWPRICLFVLLSCTCMLVADLVTGVPLAIFWGLLDDAKHVAASGNISSLYRWVFGTQSSLALAIVAAVCAWAVGKDRWKSLRQFLSLPSEKFILLGAGLPAFVWALVVLIIYAAARISWASSGFGNTAAPVLGSFLSTPTALSFAIYLPAAFFEEIIWRGFLLPPFVNRYSLYRGLFFISLAWGLSHFQADFGPRAADSLVGFEIFWRSAYCIALGFVLGWLTLRSKSIWPAALAHGLSNVSSSLIAHMIPNFITDRLLKTALWAALACILFRYWPAQAEPDPSPPSLALATDLPT